MKRFLLGSWSTPAGNSCDVFILSGEGRCRALVLEWDRFPLSPSDELFYTVAILPALTRRCAEYLERRRPALVVLA